MDQNYDVAGLWEELSTLLLKIEDNQPLIFLETIHEWIKAHDSIFDEERILVAGGALELLTEVEVTEFVIQNPNILSQIKSFISRSLDIQQLDDLTGIVKRMISRIVIVTDDEYCPSCDQGTLGYWVWLEAQTKFPVLECDECSLSFLLNKERNFTRVAYGIYPATRSDLRWIAPLRQKITGRMPEWVKLLGPHPYH